MATESYAKKIVNLNEIKQERAVAERKELCDALGLPQQKIVGPDTNRERFYREVSGEELYVWRSFLPTTYRRSGAGNHVRAWSDYAFDNIPNEALREIQTALESNLFHDLEIWTPERNQNDPIAVGILGQNIFLIVRWGESLIPFEKIRQAVIDGLLSGFEEVSLSEKARESLRIIALQAHAVIYYCGRFLLRTHCGERLMKIREGVYSLTGSEFCGRCGMKMVIWQRYH